MKHNKVYTVIDGQESREIRILAVSRDLGWVVQHIKSGKVILDNGIPFTTESLKQLLLETVQSFK